MRVSFAQHKTRPEKLRRVLRVPGLLAICFTWLQAGRLKCPRDNHQVARSMSPRQGGHRLHPRTPGNDDAVCVDIGGKYLGLIGDFASCRWPLQLTKKASCPTT